MYCYDTIHNQPYKNKQVNTFIPVRQVKVANTGAGKDVSLTLYDYRLLYSMTEPYRAIASQYGIPDTESNRRSYTPMYAAELSYLKFALPYNMPVKLEVYADGERLGSLAGLRYMGHVTGSQGMYTIKTGYNEPVVREDMKKRYEQRCEETNSLTGMFLPMEIVPGIGLTGEPLAYRTLMGYYDYYHLAYPFGDSVSGNNADDTDTETEGISVSGNDRETEEATEELNKESSSGTEETAEKESTEESSFATEEAGAAEESGSAEESRTAENGSAGTEESAETERSSGTEESAETESISGKCSGTAEESAEVPEREAGFEPYALHYSQWGGENTAYTLNIHEDLLGSATAYTYQGGWNDGQWANKHEFNAWGYNTKSPTYNYDPMYRSTEPYFTGHQFDGSLNIYYADHRFYDAETGTWLSPDPVKDGLNWYQYCGNNPATYVDPTGLYATLNEGLNHFNSLSGSNNSSVENENIMVDINDIWDKHTIERIKKLHPKIQNNAIEFILDAQTKGINLRISSGYRSFEEQNDLYAQGRTKAGGIVTKAKGGESYHNYGLAFDVIEMKNGTALWENDWDKIGDIGKAHGFEWGGDWTSIVDKPHFQMDYGYTIGQLLEMYNQGKHENGYVKIE